MDGVKRALSARGMSAEQGWMIVHDKSEWRVVVSEALTTCGGGSCAFGVTLGLD